VKLEYRSLQTDTLNEQTFFRQEIAALAAGRQSKMWNYILTFVHEQGLEYTGYATDAFLSDIASQVPGLRRTRWRRDREDAFLSKRVAVSLHSAYAKDLSSTPTFLIGLTRGEIDKSAISIDRASMKTKVEASLRREIASLDAESAGDNPALRSSELSERKEVKELRGE
jgi:hypothetical protein